MFKKGQVWSTKGGAKWLVIFGRDGLVFVECLSGKHMGKRGWMRVQSILENCHLVANNFKPLRGLNIGQRRNHSRF